MMMQSDALWHTGSKVLWVAVQQIKVQSVYRTLPPVTTRTRRSVCAHTGQPNYLKSSNPANVPEKILWEEHVLQESIAP